MDTRSNVTEPTEELEIIELELVDERPTDPYNTSTVKVLNLRDFRG